MGAKEEVVRTSREGRDVTGQGVVKGIWGTKHFPQKRRRGTDERYSGSTQQSLQNPRLSFKSDVRNFVQFEGKEQASVRAGNTVKADPESGTSQTIAREGNWRDSNVSDTSSSTSSESESMDERDDEEEKGVLWKVFLGRYAENGTESIAEAVDASDPNTALEEESQDEYLLKDPRWTCLCTVPKSNVVGLSTKHPSLNCLFYDPPSPEASKRRKAEAVQNIPTTVCLCNAPAKHHSGHPWVFTRKGIRLAKLWRTELMTRRKAYTASYGHSDSLTPVREVMELILDDFTIKTARQPPQILAVWAFVEAMALFLNENVLCLPDRSIDTEQRARIVKMMGDAFLTTVKLLIKQGLFNQAGSPIAPNLGLVLMMFLIYTPRGSNGDVCEQTTANWAEEVTCLAEEYHIRGDHLPNLESKIHTLNKAHDDDTQLQVAKGPAQVIKLTVKRGRDETSLDDDCDLQPVVDDQHQDIVSSQPPNWLSDDQRSQWGFRQERESTSPHTR